MDRGAGRHGFEPHPGHGAGLGLTIKAMRDFVDALGTLEDAVAECNAAIPRRKDGSLKFPENGDFNGYGGFSFHAPKDNH